MHACNEAISVNQNISASLESSYILKPLIDRMIMCMLTIYSTVHAECICVAVELITLVFLESQSDL